MYEPEETATRMEQAIEYFFTTEPGLSAKLADALIALKKVSGPQNYIWTETCDPDKNFFRLTLWRGGAPIQVACLTSNSHYWVQYCGHGWNLVIDTPAKTLVNLGQLVSFKASCEYLRARAKKEWGCPLTEEDKKTLSINPTKPWA